MTLAQKRQELDAARKRRDERGEVKIVGEIAALLTTLQEFDEAWRMHEQFAAAWVDQAAA